jgi:transcription elongation factor GreA-like protein
LRLQFDNLKKWSNNEILQLMRPAYPRNTKLEDLIIISRIDRVIEEQALKTLNTLSDKKAPR